MCCIATISLKVFGHFEKLLIPILVADEKSLKSLSQNKGTKSPALFNNVVYFSSSKQ